MDPTWPLGTGWPGWELVNGVWVESDVPETPQLVLRVTINPTDEVCWFTHQRLPIVLRRRKP